MGKGGFDTSRVACGIKDIRYEYFRIRFIKSEKWLFIICE